MTDIFRVFVNKKKYKYGINNYIINRYLKCNTTNLNLLFCIDIKLYLGDLRINLF